VYVIKSKAYVIAAQFEVGGATIFRHAGNHTYYRFGADASSTTPGSPDPLDNGAFTTMAAKLEIQATP
jgi:hypothetical protein